MDGFGPRVLALCFVFGVFFLGLGLRVHTVN